MMNGNHIYNYSLYGLKIRSQIPMPELLKVNETECINPDVTVTLGLVYKDMEDAVIANSYIKLSKKAFYLHIKDVAHYYVEDGKRIIVEVDGQKNIEEIKVFLLGTCFGMLLSQRNCVAIHGGAVVISEQGIIITGNSGAGKSTLTSALRKYGFSFLADDVSALGHNLDGNTIIYPTYPQQKLCRDALHKMGYGVNDFNLVDAERDKYAIPLKKGFYSSPISLKAIYELDIGETKDVIINEIFGAEKVKVILRNIYRIETIRLIGIDQKYFKKCIEIANTVQVYRIVRPKEGFTVNEQVELIMRSIEKIEKISI
jgi:hypothetical protein